jgi:hypothetical protein
MALVSATFETTSRAGILLVLAVAGVAGALVAAAAFPLLTRRPWRELLGSTV